MRHIRLETRQLDGHWHTADQRQDIRRHWDRLLHLARYLDQRERTLLEAAVEQGGRVSRLARLTHRSPTSVRRQMRDIARRLNGTELRAMLAHPAAFSELEKACLREHLVRKCPIRRVAEQLDISVYRVRKTLAAARAKAERLNTAQREMSKSR